MKAKTVVIIVLILLFVVMVLNIFYVCHLLDPAINFSKNYFGLIYNPLMKLITNSFTLWYWNTMSIIVGMVAWILALLLIKTD